MNDIDKRENEAAEESTEAETETKAELSPEEGAARDASVEEQEEQPAPAAKKSGGALPAVLALLLAGVALGASYYLWQQLEQVKRDRDSLVRELRAQPTEQPGQISVLQAEVAELRAEVSPLQEKISTLGRELQQQAGQESEAAAAALDVLQRQLNEIRDQISRQASSQAGGETLRIAAEVEYLMQIANRRLQLEQDVQTAIAALQMADKRLLESGDPLWVAVREQLAAELAALRSVPRVDRDGLSLQLATMIEQVASIEPVMVMAATEEAEEQGATSVTAREERSLETLPGDAWRGLKSLLVIRRHDGKLPVFLPPDQLYFLKQNLQLQLEAARYALLRSDQQLYTDSLERAGGWLTRYFDPEQEAVKSLQEQIDRLKQEGIQPALPDVSGSLRALRAQVGNRAEAKQP